MTPVLALLSILLPVIAFLSGIALPYILLLMLVLTLAALPRRVLVHPGALLVNHRRLLGMIGLFFIVPLLSTVWSITPKDSLGVSILAAVTCVGGYFAFLYAAALPAPSRRQFWGMAIAFLFVAILMLQEQLGGGLIEWFYNATHQSYSRFINKNINRGLCAFAVLIWPFLLLAYRLGEARRGWMVVALLAVAVFGMHSLSAKVGMAAGIIAFCALRRWPVTLSRALAITLPLFLVLLPLVYLAAMPMLAGDGALENHLPSSSVHRLHIWQALMDKVNLRPLFGWGIDTTRALPLGGDVLATLGLPTPPLHPHNTPLEMLIEQGVLGLFLGVAALALLLREWLRTPVEDTLARATGGAIIAAYAVAGISSFGMWQDWWIATLWITGALWRRSSSHIRAA